MEYFLFVLIPTLLLGLYAQFKVKHTFGKYSQVPVGSGLTGAAAALEMLRAAGLDHQVGIERVDGFLSDHYDPKHKVLRLSPDVYDHATLAAVGVACHEAGHAVQDARNYAPLVLRNAIVPTAAFGSNFAFILIIAGLLLQFQGLAMIGLILFGAVVLFQLVNLPVEFDASARAREMLGQLGIVSGPAETGGVAAVLNAAALTYVAATVAAVANLLYYGWMIFGGHHREE